MAWGQLKAYYAFLDLWEYINRSSFYRVYGNQSVLRAPRGRMVQPAFPAGCWVGLAGFTFFAADAALCEAGRLGFVSATFFSIFLAGGVTAEAGGAG